MATELETQSGQPTKTASAAPVALSEPVQINLERGRRLLAHLQRAARAARLEVQAAELEAVMADAQSGDGSRLELWLDNFYDEAAASATTGGPPPSIVAPIANVGLADDDTNVATGWSAYLVHAERRLKALEASQSPFCMRDDWPGRAVIEPGTCPRAADLVNSSIYLAGDSASPPDDASASYGAASPNDTNISVAVDESPMEKEVTPASIANARETEPPLTIADEPGWLTIKHGSLDAASLASLGTLSERSQTESRPLSRRTISGVGLSLVGHCALLTALFMITYRPQREPASLGSAVLSVNAVAENIETGQPFDSLEPIEMELSETSPVSAQSPVADMANNDLANLENAYSSQLDASSIAAALSAVNSTGASAIAAATSNPRGNSSGSGKGHGRSGGPKLGGQFFGVGAGGNYFCYVVDSSGSMRGGAWESAKVELLRSLTTLSPTQRFYIIFFAREVSAIPEPGQREPAAHGLYATPDNIDHARRWIETIKLDRGGPPNEALGLAIDRQPDAIYLLTDGVTKVDVCGFLREHNRSYDIVSGQQVRVPIHPIAYYSLDGQKLLKQLALENEGQFHYVPAK